ncbi:hypothetical protein AQUCO_00900021v1 [Aquilegia coerulea]|uniref:C3H1-type domain-containing protein n=1 Tax=Aquilegia coerulea TaxID=218851 RepID=A0A2G5EBI0_AQUCA|nr:hypothetical protein AQUCO_00900021v1 [Aquilegia coerulea]PIA53113.1 hypothetical protein AQUCO_00900021v1 [Aquilegia coerulea]
MDSYEATRIVFQRIQSLDPENASKIMGFLLIQDHGEKEMIRLAFGPETLIHTLIITAYNELPLSSSSSSSSSSSFITTTTTTSPPSPFLHPISISRQNSSSSSSTRIPSTSWNPPHNLISPNSTSSASYASVVATNANVFNSDDPIVDDLHLHDNLSFLNDNNHHPDFFYPSPELATSPDNNNWEINNAQHHRRSLSVTDIGLGSDPFGWKPCLYYARGYCKNGTSCRFLHAPPDSPDSSTGKLDVMEQCHDYLIRSKTHQHRLTNASHFMPSNSFPYSASSGKCINFLLQQQHQNDTHRVAAAAAAGLMLGGEDFNQIGRSRNERNDFSSITVGEMVNPGSRQIYLTFPADSTFREEDVSNYFSIYGPVQDVRIPYQQKRMFGFVTFVYPETVKLILAKGNPHFVCDARVLVKPYKEKGKVPDKKQQQQQQQLVERGEFSPSTTPSGHDHRDPYELQLGMRMQSSPRLLYNTHEQLLRRKLEEQAELQQAIELHSRKLMGLHLFDGNKHHRRNLSTGAGHIHSPTHPHTFVNPNFILQSSSPDQCSSKVPEDNCASSAISTSLASVVDHTSKQQAEFSYGDNGKENFKHGGCNSNDSVEHNLPNSPFASPTKTNGDPTHLFFTAGTENEQSISATSAPSATLSSSSSNNINILSASSLQPGSSLLDMASFKTSFLQMPRLGRWAGDPAWAQH